MNGINEVVLNKVSPEIEQLVIRGARCCTSKYQRIFEQFLNSGEKVMEVNNAKHVTAIASRNCFVKAIANCGYEKEIRVRIYGDRVYLVRI